MVVNKINIGVSVEGKMPQITLKGTQSSLWMSENLSQFMICVSLIWSLGNVSMVQQDC